MNNKLPPGWTVMSFMDVFDIQGGTQPPKKTFKYEPTDGYVRLLQIRDFGTKPQPTFVRSKTTLKTCRKEDILIGRYGASVGRICTGMDGAYNVALAKVIIPERFSKQYVFWLLQSPTFQKPLLEIQRSAQDGFNKEDLAEIMIPLAPLAEQRRIVAKLERLLGQVDACQKRLTKIPTLLKRFRQSILAAACSGHLTADWRDKNSAIDNDGVKDLPNGWSFSIVGNVLEGLKYGTSMKCGYERRGVPVLRIPNVVSGKIDPTDLKFAELPTTELTQLRLIPGDLLLIRSNGSVSLVGRSAIVSAEQKGFAYAGYLIRLRPNRRKIDPEFLNLVLASYDVRLQIELEARSTSGVNNINSEEVQALHFLLPPLLEQEEIVRRVGTFFALADRIEARFAQGRKHVDNISQTILTKAFRGELVPTEFELAKADGRSFEPAEELLERIGRNGEPERKKERATTAPTKTRSSGPPKELRNQQRNHST